MVAVALAGCATSGPPTGATATGGDIMAAGDVIAVKIQGVTDPPGFEGTIDEGGEIEMLYLGRIKAAGLTTKELAERIKYLFIQKGYYPPSVLENMLVTVYVGTRYYYMTGEGPRGRFQLSGPTTVYKAILSNGGSAEFADLKRVIVHRGGKKIRVNCVKAATDPKYDIDVQSGDVIEMLKKPIVPFLPF